MAAVWQVREAKNRFSEVIEKALNEGPQVAARHGRPVVKVVAFDEVEPAQWPKAMALPSF